MSEQDIESKSNQEDQKMIANFKEKLDIDEDIAMILVREGIHNIDTLAHIDLSALQAVEEFEGDIAEALISRAKDVMLSDILLSDNIEVPEELLELASMTEEIGRELVMAGIKNRDDLADFAVDELLEKINLGEDIAGKIIMEARSKWDV